MAQTSEAFSFIIIGAGGSGCVVASRLAARFPRKQILLIEAGGNNADLSLLDPKLQYGLSHFKPFTDWSYATVPQSNLHGKILPYSRGKGLGGSTATNYGAWTIGHKEDFNEWARLVDDECWQWEGKWGVRERFKKIENLHAKNGSVATIEPVNAHGNGGMVDISYNELLRDGRKSAIVTIAEEQGITINTDINSGHTEGIAYIPATFNNGLRVTSKTAYLKDYPPNLHIVTDSPVAKVIFDERKKATGVQLCSGRIFSVTNEVIVSAGAVGTPCILLHSGIGPADELAMLAIPVIYDLPGVGKNLTEHPSVCTTMLLSRDVPPFQESPTIFTGLPALFSSPEFSALPISTQQYLSKVPSAEMVLACPFSPFVPLTQPPTPHRTILHIVMSPQSRGTVKLSSLSPEDPPLIDLNFLSHEYDRRAMIEILRYSLSFQRNSSWQRGVSGVAGGPNSESDDDIIAFARKNCSAAMHTSGTCKMGVEKDKEACVDRNFCVRGVDGLRVVDMSIAPLLVGAHTQSTAYLIGELASEKLINEYGNTL